MLDDFAFFAATETKEIFTEIRGKGAGDCKPFPTSFEGS
jgi:hypothetical protein